MPFEERRAFASPTGAVLNLLVKKVAEPARAVVQINHGLAEHAARYARFADHLAASGFQVYAHDHRGHGGTTALDAPSGIFARESGAEKVIADVLAIHDLIAREHPGLPVIVFGHSMGGLIALNFVQRHSQRIAGAAIWNANFSAGPAERLARLLLLWERFRLGSDVPSRLLPKLTFQAWARQIPDRCTGFDWLSRDRAEVDAYIADPLCGWDASVSMWRDIFDLIFHGSDDRNLADVRKDLPFHLVGGDKDPATAGGKAVRNLEARLRRLGFSGVTTRIYPDTRHESLNEMNRETVVADFVEWANMAACH
ncbi:alpha/beta hydrolase [Mesorhizobium koreense]|jgi:alpha-beta hydrolase superfamily lysophospholipase|uniref:alpha/beta hydrolase n=1 Tax=Mesorhizobium koreense TaxID=3074855 RepID=UPI00287B7C0A|nr:alpha/beta hydrolase [Mesorhizobium sp. WR6]